MEVFRISRAKFANALTASGVANRWNMDGEYVIYAGSSRSLSTLEMVVHRGGIMPQETYKVMVIHIHDHDHLYKQIYIKDLPEDWRLDTAYINTQPVGSKWYNSQETLVLKVPSAIIPHEYNYVINTKHTAFTNSIRLVSVEDYFWDPRL
jgi:RES domain-containing protein